MSVKRIRPVNNARNPSKPEAMETNARFVTTCPNLW